MKEKFLQVKDLEVIYKTDLETVYAVNNISFDLDKGETLGLVGETGAGKTTTALSILRLLPERTAQIINGSIELEGRNVLELSEKEMQKIRGEKVSMIFQDPMTALNPVLTVGDQIAESLILHDDQGRSKEVIEARVEEVLELVGIPAARKKDYPHQFSGGQRQRICIARSLAVKPKQRVVIAIALACNPGLLIVDEPTTALDVTIQAQVLAMMQDLKEKVDTAMIMITHDLGIVAQTCDKVAVMYAGEIIEYGTVEDIFTGDAHHPYTVGLFGSIPNLEGEEDRLHPIDGMMPDPTDLPSGCYFSPRCPKCTEKCREVHPEEAVSGTHKIRCHLFENLAKEV